MQIEYFSKEHVEGGESYMYYYKYFCNLFMCTKLYLVTLPNVCVNRNLNCRDNVIIWVVKFQGHNYRLITGCNVGISYFP